MPIANILSFIAMMVASVVYLTFVLTASITTNKPLAMYFDVTTAGIVYLFQVMQAIMPNNIITKLLFLLTIVFGAVAGIFLLV